MSVHRDDVKTLREWLAEGSPVRSANPSADVLVERLAQLGLGQGWSENPQRVDEYARSFDVWFTGDNEGASMFASMTQSPADAGMLIDLLLHKAGGWEQKVAASPVEAPTAQGGRGPSAESVPARGDENGQAPIGYRNPNFDGTAGTEYYRIDDAGTYLFAASERSGEWLTYEWRRHNADSGLEARFAAELPDAEALADKIVTDIGAVIGGMIADNPELAAIDVETLIDWSTRASGAHSPNSARSAGR